MELKKKGAFFTMIGILLISTILYAANINKGINLREKSISVESRVQVISNLLSDIEDDLERGLYISSYRALFNEVNYVTEIKGDYLSDSNAGLIELLLNGTIEDNPGEWVMDNTLKNWSRKMELIARDMEIDLDIQFVDLIVKQEDPWGITVYVNVTVDAYDNMGTANWTTDKSARTRISIINFEDPIWSVSTRGTIYNFIKPQNDLDFVDSSGNPEHLINHTYESLYVSANWSPSFMMRLEGDMDESIYGMESLVDPDYFEQKTGIPIQDFNKSLNDFIFFDKTKSNNTGCFVEIMPGWFKIHSDSRTVEFYELVGNTTQCG